MDSVIELFFACKPIAVVGASDKARSFGLTVYQTLKKNGYQPVAVNPNYERVDGDRCYRSLSELSSEVEAAVFVLSPAAAMQAVAEAKQAEIKRIWFQQGANYKTAIANAEAAGLQIVKGRCVLMYAQPVESIHAVHRWINKLFGRL